MKIFILIGIVWSCRLIMNIYYFSRIKALEKKYLKYWQVSNNAELYYSEIKELFKKSGVTNSKIGYAEPIGYGRLQTGNVSIVDNMFVNDSRIVSSIIGFFSQSIGTFRKRIFENFNPIFWIECLLFLPRNVIKYLGVNTETVFTKIFQLMYWLASFLYVVYSEQINKIIQEYLSNLFK